MTAQARPTWLDDIVARIAASPAATPGGIAGCSVDEIAALESRYGVRLPQSYKDVLAAIGRRADGFLDRDEFDFFQDQLLILTGKARDHADAPGFASNTFFIRGRYLEQFEFIVCEGGEDAPVYYWSADDDAPVEVFRSIRAWLEAICADELS
jgi:hypothetical protein